MKRNNLLAILSLSIGVLFLGSSCKNDEVITDPNLSITIAASDEAMASRLSDGIISDIEQIITNYSFVVPLAVKSTHNDVVYPIVTVTPNDTATYPKSFVIDFGTAGYLGVRGNTLKGVVNIKLTGKVELVNSIKILTYSNFSINDLKFTGIDSVVNKGLNTSLAPIELIKTKDTIALAGTSNIIWKATRARARYDNAGTQTMADDSYSVTGSSSGIASTGLPYGMYISTVNPLVCLNNYPYFIQGSSNIIANSKSALFDYGSGQLDENATMIVGMDTIKIMLK